MKVIRYINLTAGLYFIKKGLLDISDSNIRYCHLQSSHLESKSYDKFFCSISDDLLFNLALGNRCIIYDCTSNRKPKVIKIGIPLIKYVLNRRWFNKEVRLSLIGIEYCRKVYSLLQKHTKKKIDYFKHYLLTSEVRLEGNFLKLEKESSDTIIEYFKRKYL